MGWIAGNQNLKTTIDYCLIVTTVSLELLYITHTHMHARTYYPHTHYTLPITNTNTHTHCPLHTRTHTPVHTHILPTHTLHTAHYKHTHAHTLPIAHTRGRYTPYLHGPYWHLVARCALIRVRFTAYASNLGGIAVRDGQLSVCFLSYYQVLIDITAGWAASPVYTRSPFNNSTKVA